MTHGTPTAYGHHGCRCPACRAANTARIREYRKRRTTSVPTDRRVTTPGTTEKCPGDVGASPGVAHEEYAS